MQLLGIMLRLSHLHLLILFWSVYVIAPLDYFSGVNDKPITDFSYVFGINNEIRKEYFGTGN